MFDVKAQNRLVYAVTAERTKDRRWVVRPRAGAAGWPVEAKVVAQEEI